MVIEAQGLTKRYGKVVAVEGLNLAIEAGEVYGLLGPNGSGKTTTILMLLGLTEPSAGTVRVLGFDPAREPLSLKRQVGYLPDSVGFYGEMTAWENLAYIARLNGLPKAEAERRMGRVLERMGLAEVADRPVSAFSRGMRQRLGLAEVLLKEPKVVILDEPTLGLDPEAAQEFLGMIRGLKAEGITVLLSSHLLHQVQAICDRVGLFHKGRLVLEGRVEELAQRVLGGAYRIRLEASPLEGLAERLGALPGVARVQLEGTGLRLEAAQDIRSQVARAVLEAGASLTSLVLEQPSLDEVYARYFQEVRHAA
ncbi:MAG: ABC transporter ATP-binding protein [Meiothermus sp.]|uniref:ABC transporter ATP-binding protein n=1 Tax=Meiothermus sp. TaxID=1955249 RepID=UPI0025E9062F|nr:ABC transporter ATP-binding protein [Meiothermus sp.]MCS7057878.1 ABC transporter ATP-binding protein [Meiothermus sp.]MCS7194246.1 ABC transporter ATP-binding protein [Meiothermus sp.]MCX7740464.1 ABC transporter ATP-binding protein [Meiothermus sp.]MDW8090820.1 ABC transporter ATP-binding protein [Meiothermus sp.]MDW8480758.1 ABC transporter ATP-binding protein [Meiothermus sp.]